jgi:hypothetical protein
MLLVIKYLHLSMSHANEADDHIVYNDIHFICCDRIYTFVRLFSEFKEAGLNFGQQRSAHQCQSEIPP